MGNGPSDIRAIREARSNWLAKEGANPRDQIAQPPQKRHRRRGQRTRGIDGEAQRLDAIARWLVSDEK